MYTEKKNNMKRKNEKTVRKQHKERAIAGEILAIDPIHKPRGGYKRLLQEMLLEYNDCEEL